MTGQQLKNSILQMAVQGKLVPQDSNDEPASVLLERIRAEKEQLIKEKKIKKEKSPSVIFRGADNLPYEKVGKNEPVCIADEVPFEIPESWEWVRLGNVIELQSGQDMTPDKYNSNGNGIPYITGASNIENGKVLINRWTNCGRAFAYKGDILLTCKGTVGTMAVLQESQVHIARQIMAIRPIGELYISYIQLVLQTLVESLKAAAKSMIPGIARDDVLQSLFPVPPFNEQQRIVSKFSMIIPYMEQYSMVDAELSSLNSIFPETLKKSILQEAIQGKLVQQDPLDEPASVLLERIRAEKERLIQEGKIKRDKHESVIYRRDNSHYEKRGSEEFCIDEELPFDLPETWSWARLGELCSVVTGRLDANAQTIDGKYAFFTCGKEIFRTDTYAFDCDAILLGGNNASGDYKMHRYSGKFNAYQRVYVISGREPDFLNYLYYVITFWLGHLKKNSQGTTTRFIKLGQVTGMLVPVPPCAEQKHIIQTIQLLLNECDHLQ